METAHKRPNYVAMLALVPLPLAVIFVLAAMSEHVW